MKKKRVVYFVSDRTGLTAESYGRSLLAQFPGFEFEHRKISFIDSQRQAEIGAEEIRQAVEEEDSQPIVFSTLVESGIHDIIDRTGACVINLFSVFIEPLEGCLGEKSAHTQGISHSIFGNTEYQRRLDAIEYALAHDDGVRPDQYEEAEVVLVGVSRCGKTPSSLYLAMNFSIRVANYPMTEEELESDALPECLSMWKDKLVGLTIRPAQLSAIRQRRRPNSSYSSPAVCQKQVRTAERIFSASRIPVFDTTDTSIEEIAGSVVKTLGLRRH